MNGKGYMTTCTALIVVLLALFSCASEQPSERIDAYVETFPTVESPTQVNMSQAFSLIFYLSEELITPEVEILEGDTAATGALKMEAPENVDSWEIGVVVFAPGFNYKDGRNQATITLNRTGNSTRAKFDLIAKPIREAQRKLPVYFTLWRNDAYQGRMVYHIDVMNPAKQQETTPASGSPESTSPRTAESRSGTQPLEIDLYRHEPRLTLWIMRNELYPGTANIAYDFTLNGEVSPLKKIFTLPGDFARRLNLEYAELQEYAIRGLEPLRTPAQAETQKKMRLTAIKGFGKRLFDQYAPPEFKEVVKGYLAEPAAIRKIDIYSDDPAIPWELMYVYDDQQPGSGEFLGILCNVGRWHITPAIKDKPPRNIHVTESVVIAPEYTGNLALQSQSAEIDSLNRIFGFKKWEGNFSDFQNLFENPPKGIIHFAGHGVAVEKAANVIEYAIVLEDVAFDIDKWRGSGISLKQSNPLIFFNACDIGQGQKVGNFVEGWAPVMLESGASGFIGGLWALGDKGAAAFATQFYKNLDKSLDSSSHANVSSILQNTRRRFYETYDPTYLAYVFYGDPNLTINRN